MKTQPLDKYNLRVDCWNWQGKVSQDGYGAFHYYGRQEMSVHRMTFQLFKGMIHHGCQLDHLCENKLCCNPWHLQIVSPTEHGLITYERQSAQNSFSLFWSRVNNDGMLLPINDSSKKRELLPNETRKYYYNEKGSVVRTKILVRKV